MGNAEYRPYILYIVVIRGDAHEAQDADVFHGLGHFAHSREVFHFHAEFAFFAGHIDLQENILYFADLAGFLIHSFEQVFGIDRVDEVEVFDGMLGLIGLQMTD